MIFFSKSLRLLHVLVVKARKLTFGENATLRKNILNMDSHDCAITVHSWLLIGFNGVSPKQSASAESSLLFLQSFRPNSLSLGICNFICIFTRLVKIPNFLFSEYFRHLTISLLTFFSKIGLLQKN